MSVRDPDRLFALVQAGFATRRKMLRQHARGVGRRRRVRRARASTRGRGPRRCRSATGRGCSECDVDAFAKLTLSLHVTGVRADGYHELDAMMVSVTRAARRAVDRARRRARRSTSRPVRRPACRPTRRTSRGARPRRAARTVRDPSCTRAFRPARGLGGGSADAAAVLVALGADRAHRARRSAPTCRSACAVARRACAASATMIEPVALAGRRRRDRDAAVRLRDRRRVPRRGTSSAARTPTPNDLEPAAHHVEPRLVAFKRAVEEAAGAPAILAGSGSSYAVVFDDAAPRPSRRGRASRKRSTAGCGSADTTDAGVVLNP